MNLLSIGSSTLCTLSQAVIAGGVAKVFDITTPKAAATYVLGAGFAYTLLNNAPFASEHQIYTIGMFYPSHIAGKILADQMHNIDVKAKDVLKMAFGGTVAAIPFAVLAITVAADGLSTNVAHIVNLLDPIISNTTISEARSCFTDCAEQLFPV